MHSKNWRYNVNYYCYNITGVLLIVVLQILEAFVYCELNSSWIIGPLLKQLIDDIIIWEKEWTLNNQINGN